jgi:hypothetical protein
VGYSKITTLLQLIITLTKSSSMDKELRCGQCNQLITEPYLLKGKDKWVQCFDCYAEEEASFEDMEDIDYNTITGG